MVGTVTRKSPRRARLKTGRRSERIQAPSRSPRRVRGTRAAAAAPPRPRAEPRPDRLLGPSELALPRHLVVVHRPTRRVRSDGSRRPHLLVLRRFPRPRQRRHHRVNVLRSNVAQSILPGCARSRPSPNLAQCSADNTFAGRSVAADDGTEAAERRTASTARPAPTHRDSGSADSGAAESTRPVGRGTYPRSSVFVVGFNSPYPGMVFSA